jgi:hypothetical protein
MSLFVNGVLKVVMASENESGDDEIALSHHRPIMY